MSRIKEVGKRTINWIGTGINLQNLRTGNLVLRRYACSMLKYDTRDCRQDCLDCKNEMDRAISRAELAQIFHCSDSVIYNWENGITPPSLEDIYLYCDICNIELTDILVFE